MNVMTDTGDYILGHASQELDRLISQSRFLAELTEHLLRLAGLQAGMHVLDVGCGSGDVSFLAARIVGPGGSVIGIDRSPESVAAGKQIFTRNCATCHGVNAEGGPGNDLIPAAPDLTDDKWDHGSTDGEIFNVIKNGVPPEFNMIPWKDKLMDTDVWNVVNYLKSIAKK